MKLTARSWQYRARTFGARLRVASPTHMSNIPMARTRSSSDLSLSSPKSTSRPAVLPDRSMILDALAPVYWMYDAVSPSRLRDFARSKAIILSRSCFSISYRMVPTATSCAILPMPAASMSGLRLPVSPAALSWIFSYTASALMYMPFRPDICTCRPSVPSPSRPAVSELSVTDSYPRCTYASGTDLNLPIREDTIRCSPVCLESTTVMTFSPAKRDGPAPPSSLVRHRVRRTPPGPAGCSASYSSYENGSSSNPSFHAAYGMSLATYVAVPLLRTSTLSSSPPPPRITQHPAFFPESSRSISDISLSLANTLPHRPERMMWDSKFRQS